MLVYYCLPKMSTAVDIICRVITQSINIIDDRCFVVTDISIIIKYFLPLLHYILLTNEEVIQELLKIAHDIAQAKSEGEELGLTEEELAFYDALTKPAAIKDFYENDELIAITKELTETLRKNKTIDWSKRESARARMRMLIKRLLKQHRYPPEGMEDAVQTVMTQCELWTDNVMQTE